MLRVRRARQEGSGPPVLPVLPELLGLLGLLGLLALLVPPARKGPLARRDPLGEQPTKETRGRPDLQGHRALRVPKVKLEEPDLLGLQGLQGLLVRKVRKGRLEQMAHKVQPVSWDHPAPSAPPALRDPRGPGVREVTKAKPVLPVRLVL